MLDNERPEMNSHSRSPVPYKRIAFSSAVGICEENLQMAVFRMAWEGLIGELCWGEKTYRYNSEFDVHEPACFLIYSNEEDI